MKFALLSVSYAGLSNAAEPLSIEEQATPKPERLVATAV